MQILPRGPAFALSSFGSADHFWNANRTSEPGLGANECVPYQGMWRKPTAFRQPSLTAFLWAKAAASKLGVRRRALSLRHS